MKKADARRLETIIDVTVSASFFYSSSSKIENELTFSTKLSQKRRVSGHRNGRPKDTRGINKQHNDNGRTTKRDY
jgi:hypothetical protein